MSASERLMTEAKGTEIVEALEEIVEQAGNIAQVTLLEQASKEHSEDSEAWSVGKRNGVPVTSDDPTYHNNAKYWSDQAQQATIPVASQSTLGGIKVGANLSITSDGTLSAQGGGSGDGDMLKAVYDTNDDGIVDSAETLDGLTATVTELNYMDGVTSNVQTQLNGKVDAETGKGLSSNDYTTTEKAKLSEIADGAEVNFVKSVETSQLNVNGSGKLSLATAVTSKLSNFNNDGSVASGSELDDALDLKADASNVYTKTQVDSKVDETVKTSTVGSDGKTVSFTGIDTSKTYELYADIGSSFSDISPVGIQSMTLNGTTLTYVLTNASSGMSCKLREIKL